MCLFSVIQPCSVQSGAAQVVHTNDTMTLSLSTPLYSSRSGMCSFHEWKCLKGNFVQFYAVCAYIIHSTEKQTKSFSTGSGRFPKFAFWTNRHGLRSCQYVTRGAPRSVTVHTVHKFWKPSFSVKKLVIRLFCWMFDIRIHSAPPLEFFPGHIPRNVVESTLDPHIYIYSGILSESSLKI